MTRPANFATGKISQISEFGNVLRSWQGCCEVGNGVAKLAMVLRSWQCGLRSWQCGLRIWQWVANLAKWFAKLTKWFAKLAMRNFAKLLKFLCEKRSSQMHSECG